MKIKRLEIRDRATLVDVKADFGDINVIYGRNGTGKTLLSETLRAVENRESIRPGNASIHLDDGSEVSSTQFTEGRISDRIRVFNRYFVEENVFGEDLEAIVLGGDVKDELDRAKSLRLEIETLVEERSRLRERAKIEKSSLDDLLIARGQEIRRSLGPVARVEGADRRWPNFNKSDVDRIAEEIGIDAVDHQMNDDEIIVVSNAISEHSFPRLSEVKVKRPDSGRWLWEAKKLCATKLGSALVDELSRDSELASWLEAGLSLMDDADDCPFCKQIVPDDRIDQLRSHFTNAYSELGRQVGELSSEITQWLADTAKQELHNPDKVRGDLREGYERCLSELHGMLSRHSESARHLLRMLSEKRADLSTELRVEGSADEWRVERIHQFNDHIRAHNNRDEVVALGSKIERAMVASIMPKLTESKREIARLDREINSLGEKIKEKALSLDAAVMASRSNARAADRLNTLVGDFIGHRELRFELNDDGSTFRIERHGAPPTGLSEGERNALGLMYFLMRLEDERFEPDESIVVFDDPITSFDDQRLFDAVTRMLYRTGLKGGSAPRIGQMLLLTHHLGLLGRLWRELRREDGAHYFEMQSSHQPLSTVRRTSLERVRKPTRFRYHVAFGELYDMVFNSVHVNNPGNSLRLCIEGFLFNLTPTAFGDGRRLETTLNEVYRRDGRESVSKEDIHVVCQTANAGSHDDNPDSPVSEGEEFSRFREAAEKLFKLMEEVAPMHYADMERGVKERRRQ